MYTIKEAAEALGMSKNGIKYHLTALPAEDVQRDPRGKVLITDAGMQALRVKLGKPVEDAPAPETEPPTPETSTGSDDRITDALLITIDTLRAQLAEKDKQIEALTDALRSAQAAVQQAQALQAGALVAVSEGHSRRFTDVLRGMFNRGAKK